MACVLLVTCRHPTSRAGGAPAVEPGALLTAASRTHLPPGVPMTELARRTLLWLAAIAIAAGCGSTNPPRTSVDPPPPVLNLQKLDVPQAGGGYHRGLPLGATGPGSD